MALKFTRLTRPAIRNLNSGQRINEHGISAERLNSGDLRYCINIMVDGQRIHRVVGRESEGVTREQAERTIEALRTKAREGRFDLPSGRKVHRTFQNAASEYLTQIEHHPMHGRNIGPKRRHLLERLAPYFKGQRLDQLTDFSISQYVKQRRENGAATATTNRELSSLSHFLNRAVEWKWIRADQKPKIPKGEEARKKIVVLTDDDKRALMQAALADQDPLTWMFTAIAMGTGMRHSEILRVRWEDIDHVNRRIYIGKAKAGQREQPIPASLAALLGKEHKQLGEPNAWLFPTSRKGAKHEHRQQMSEQFRRAVERAMLDPGKVTPHVMRHTAITGLIKEGVDLPTVQRISGHKTLAMVLRYTHLSDDHVDQSVAKMDAAFSAAIAPELHKPLMP
ncbi:integrase [Novosphingobium sp. AAP83]|uniref:tyrosine-type recombinase/integrase n=1 Tax=Novosphingobium sp. AAP83 TaxID=1523425 RepID=UPI0006B99110|nr:tyrosine-type recombinase/integrase [Novosphingobium sp. AAP83]KPF89027.1 integrase [Novosphingobium sp. AAP83]